jgi:hypothetical protein
MARVFNEISSGVNLSSDFFLKNFYRSNRNVIKASTRNDYHKTELSYEDTRALKRAISKLSSFDYSEDENGNNIVSTIQAFVKKQNASRYQKYMDKVFGDGACEILAIRKYGGIRVI